MLHRMNVIDISELKSSIVKCSLNVMKTSLVFTNQYIS